MEPKEPIVCYFTLHGVNYKNGFATSCPQNPDQLAKMSHTIKPSEIFNSAGFRKHREEMMSGTWSRGCKHLCHQPESVGSHSMRLDYNADLSLYMNEVAWLHNKNRNSEPGEAWIRGLKHVELRFSNSCNMSCRHCSTVYSSGWVSKLKFYKPDQEAIDNDLKQLLRTEHKEENDDNGQLEISMSQVEEIVDDLCYNAIGLEKVEFAGGEVLNQKQFFYFLKLLAKHPRAKELIIGFHTNFNANFDPTELNDLLKPFAAVIIHISVDAGKNIYPYFRTGDWEKLKSNIEKFRQVSTNSNLVAVVTTSAYQMLDISNIFQSLLEIDFDGIDAAIVYSPIYLNPVLATFKFKNEILYDIEKTKTRIKHERSRRMIHQEFHRKSWKENKQRFDDVEGALRALDNIQNYVMNTNLEEYSKNLGYREGLSLETIFKRFEVYIRKTDEIWKQNFNEFMVDYKINDGKIERITQCSTQPMPHIEKLKPIIKNTD